MKTFLTITLALFISLYSFSQLETRGQVSGTVTSKLMPIEGATIQLFRLVDQKILRMVVSNKEGAFVVPQVDFGTYSILVTAVGYKNFSIDKMDLSSSTPRITKSIILEAITKSLKDVTVSVKRPLIEQKPGKTLINVEASATNAGLNALELLEKSPGVSVDKDGNISLQGKSGVMVLIDGKPTYLSGADLASFLRNVQSNNLDQIEIMTNPPARYDAAGNSGIINIKTKKITIKGMNGSLSTTYTQGIYARFNSSLNLNYRKDKLNVFGSYGHNYSEGFNNLVITRNFYKADKKTIAGTSDQVTRPHFTRESHNVKAGFDYNLSKRDIIGFVVNGSISNGAENPTGRINVRDASGKITYSLNTINDNHSRFVNVSSNANFKHTFDSSGRELTADLDYARYERNDNTLMHTETYNGYGTRSGMDLALKGLIPSDINIYSIKTDYVHPLSKTFKFESGLKSSLVNTDNQVDYSRYDGTSWKVDDRSNQFIYKEAIHAGYVTTSKSWKRLNVTAGLRLEHTNSNGMQVRNDSSFTRRYTNLFPNLGIGMDLNEKHQLNFSYSRRVDRPNYGDLNPFVYFLDSLTYGQGNPYLQPQFTNKAELSHTFRRIVTTTLNYSRTNNVITQLLKQDTEKKITYQTTDNVNSMEQIGVAVMMNSPVTKWWNTNVYLNLYKNHYEGKYQADPIDIQFSTFVANVTNSFTLPKGWAVEVSGFYRSRAAEGLLVAGPMWAVNSGISKQAFKKKGSFRLGVRDIFFTQRFNGYARYSDVDVRIASSRDSRQASLSFTYRFGKNNISPARKKAGGAGEEQNRVNSGGSN
ncbi:TonB-dependent receptor [Segetibacter sp. 3557_3]|uniref:TonB-dependent receptor n=1 Tax=Segetibacter sp. 3557_3 TaxID=2547429 RepID=UPI001058D355|nr:TonB-dependent receptor [Segetibacter sp. 3557_3]TDH28913.1 TonB-dependent receptor [Segetibacter sp. 3557_3]